MNRLARHPVVWRRAAILLALCIMLAAVASTAALHDALIDIQRILEGMIAAHPVAGAFLFVLVAAISAMFAFVSIAVIVPAAVLAWGEMFSVLLLWIGWILGGCAAYAVGRFLGPRAVRWLVAGEALQNTERAIAKDAPFHLVLLLQLALPSELPGYLLGLARYKFPKYLLAVALGELPYTVMTIYLGASFLKGSAGVILVAGVALIMLSIGAFYFWRKRTHA